MSYTPTYAPPERVVPYPQPVHQNYDGRMAVGLFMSIIGVAVLTCSILVGRFTRPSGNTYVSMVDSADYANRLGWCVVVGASSLFVILLGVILIAGAEKVQR